MPFTLSHLVFTAFSFLPLHHCVCLVSVWTFQILEHLQSGSQLSVDQEVVEPPLLEVHAVAATSVRASFGSFTTPTPSGYTTPSSTPLPLELHIDEDGSCPPSSSSVSSTLVMTSSRSLQYSRVDQLGDGDSVSAKICQLESLTVSNTAKSSSQTPPDVSVPKVLSLVETPATIRQSPVKNSLSKSPSPVTVPLNSPKSLSPSDAPTSLVQSPVSKNDTSIPVTQTPEPKSYSPVPRFSSPVPKSASPIAVPNISCTTLAPKGSSPEMSPKCASPIPVPRLASPAPKTSASALAPNVGSSGNKPKISGPEQSPKTTGPVLPPKLASPVTVSPNDTLVRSPPVIRKTYTLPESSSPRASPLPAAAAAAATLPSSSLSTSPSDRQVGDILDLKWPCRDPVLDDTLDKLLCPDSAQLRETQTPASLVPGDEDRSWEEEDGMYPDYSREGTLTPMTESSWMDECYTPSTCPGTPDATLELPSQQPSALERLSASGQVGRSTWLSQNKLLAERSAEASHLPLAFNCLGHVPPAPRTHPKILMSSDNRVESLDNLSSRISYGAAKAA